MTKEGFLRNMNMFMMNTMIVTSVRKSDSKIQYNKQGWIQRIFGYQFEKC